MKRIVFISSLVFFFLFTLSNAFHPESLDLTTRILNHHHDDHHQPSSDGSDSSKILLPTETSPVPDHTGSYQVEFKEAVSEPQIIPENLNPVQTENPFFFPVRVNPIRCRLLHRFMRYPRRFGPVNELGFDPVLSYVLKNRDMAMRFPEVDLMIRMFGQRHHHHDDDHDEEDDDHHHQWVEIKEDHDEHDDDVDGHDDHREKHVLKMKLKENKKHQEKHDDDDDDDHDHDHDHKKKHVLKMKRKEKKKHQDKHDDDDDDEHEDKRDHEHEHEHKHEHGHGHNMKKYVLKKIRKFMNFF